MGVERDFVGGVPRVVGGIPSVTYAPTTALPPTTVVSGSYAPPYTTPVVSGSYVPPYTTPVVSGSYVGGVGEIDKVNAFGQVVERDFVGGVPRVVGGIPSVTYAPTT